jgi:glutamine cyclotransferase
VSVARNVLTAAVALMLAGCPSATADPGSDANGAPVPVLRPTVLGETPHDPGAYTEGIELDGSALYEGTGEVGHSELRELDPATGTVRRAVRLPGLFGEGITVVGDRILQLTWRDGVVIEWDKATFTRVREVPLSGESWGLCRDGNRLVRSDGSDRLRFLDVTDLAETGSVGVTRNGQPLGGLNELECVDGQVWANVWPSDQIVRIDPAAGNVTAVVDASRLLDSTRRPVADVLNGIAYAGGGQFLLTGKHWPTTFRVRFDPT